ncbi:MAG: hypothetical protein NVS3B3_24180 [Aquirhabdus sp.]
MNENTSERLINAAMVEFCQDGYFATDSNKIARRAGFAPQTFYRWFKDKTSVFLAAYQKWSEQELLLLGGLALENVTADQVVDIIIKHHRDYVLFRRSLRQLTVENLIIRQKRAETRLNQMSFIQQRFGLEDLNKGVFFALMFQIERLADGLAEGEFRDLGVEETEIRQSMIALVNHFLNSINQ